jgi:hypothetical protein
MTPRELIRTASLWLLYLLLHIVIGQHLSLFDTAFCFIYVGAILILPYETPRMALLFIGFLTGITADLFDNTFGIHASASVLIAYLRPILLQNQLSKKLNDTADISLTFNGLGPAGFLIYAGLLVSIHHLWLFFVEASSFASFFQTLLKSIGSIVFTMIALIFSQLFMKK